MPFLYSLTLILSYLHKIKYVRGETANIIIHKRLYKKRNFTKSHKKLGGNSFCKMSGFFRSFDCAYSKY